MEITEIILALTGVIAVIVSLITATTATKRSAFEELQRVVSTLETQLKDERMEREKLQSDLETERRQRMQMENWARRLVRQLIENNIKPDPFDEIGGE